MSDASMVRQLIPDAHGLHALWPFANYACTFITALKRLDDALARAHDVTNGMLIAPPDLFQVIDRRCCCAIRDKGLLYGQLPLLLRSVLCAQLLPLLLLL